MILRNEEECMSKGKHSEAEMIRALKKLDAGRKAADVARELGVSKHTIYGGKSPPGRRRTTRSGRTARWAIRRRWNTRGGPQVIRMSYDPPCGFGEQTTLERFDSLARKIRYGPEIRLIASGQYPESHVFR
jgi:hypothetical protein